MTAIAPTRPAEDAARTSHVDEPAPARRGLRPPSLETLFAAVFALFGWGVGIGRLSDNSFFWHLRSGHRILEYGIPHHDPFSFTASGVDWVAQSWLTEALYGALDRLSGPLGIRVLGGLVGAAITVLAFRLALRLAQDRVRAALVTAAALGGLYTLWSERPLLLGVLAFVVLLWVVEVPDSPLGRHPLVALPVLFWLWVNVHGTFALGFAYVALHLLGRRLDGASVRTGRERQLLVGSFLALVACLANPYGLALLLFPVELLARGDILRHIVEWGSPDFHTVRGQALILWLVVFVSVVARGHGRVSRRDLVVTLPFLALALWALRNVALAPLVGLPVVARALTRHDVRADRRNGIAWVLAGVLVILGVSLGARAAGEPDFRLRGYPVAAMEAVERDGYLGRRLLTDDADGGFVIMRYGTRQPVFIDDRYDMYPRGVIRDFFDLDNGSPGWQGILERRDVEVVVWERDEPLAQYLDASEEWQRTFTDRDFAVFVRGDVAG